MFTKKRILWTLAAGTIGLLCVVFWDQDTWLLGGAAAVVCGAAFLLGRQGGLLQARTKHADGAAPASLRTQVEAAVRAPQNPLDTQALVEQMLTEGRYALLLRPQIVSNLSKDQTRRAHAVLAENMAIVAGGEVSLGIAGDGAEQGEAEDVQRERGTTIIEVQAYYLDRCCVTNLQYQQFVSSGGYQQAALWDPQIWPAVVDFVDRTGCPGPRFWKHARYEPGEDDHPVIGICWYEAAAYARWIGKRLPTDAEWEKAGSAPVQLAAHALLQRRYPWGESMHRARCNVWGRGPNKTEPVDAFPAGATGTGIQQLIGNVWEWTADDFGAVGLSGRGLILPHPMKSLRGGAFDTYFESHATCQFQSAENPISRKHNIGFRCALSACDLQSVSRPADTLDVEPTPEAPESALEVASV